MKLRVLLTYQLLTGLSDAGTGLLLIFAPAFTLHLMKLHATSGSNLPFLAYIGTFVLSTGVACFYGAFVIHQPAKLEVVWLLTAITRGLVACFVLAQVWSGLLEAGWITVALTDGLLTIVQSVALVKGWSRHA